MRVYCNTCLMSQNNVWTRLCGCGAGESRCSECGICRTCAREHMLEMEGFGKQLELLARHEDYLPFDVEQKLGGNEKRRGFIGNMSLMTVRPTLNEDWDIQQENRASPCKDGRRDVHLHAFSNTDKNEDWTEQTKTIEKTVEPMHYGDDYIIVGGKLVKGPLACSLEVMLKIFFLLIVREFQARCQRKQEDIEKRGEENIRHLFLMILLFFLTENINEFIESKQTRCRKYPCLNSILYLLWRSGDVEENPGPPANSITYRNWLYDVCSVVRKATVGVSPYCKMKNIWKQQPDNWPSGELYFDPRNSNSSIHKVEAFFQILLDCFDRTRQLPHDIKSEIDAWKSNKSKDNSQLLNLYTRRVCYRSTAQSMTILQSHILVDEILEFKLDNSNIVRVSRELATDQYVITPKLFRADTTRKIASFLCRIFHGKDPEQKCDHIWKETPVGWPTDCRFYNPYNGGKRCAENEDTRLVRELITLCENNSIFLPKPYKDMIKAWLADDQALLSKLIARQTAEIGIKNALRKLQEGGLLSDSQVAKHLKELGLSVQSTTRIKITKSLKRKTANATTTSKVKRTRLQYDEEEGLDATLKELLPECSIVELLDKSDSHLLDMLSPKLSNGFLDDETDDIQCQ